MRVSRKAGGNMENVNNLFGKNNNDPEGEDVPFRLEYLLGEDENDVNEARRPFKDQMWPWPILMKVTLDNVVLGTNIGINDDINQYQMAGFSFDPHMLSGVIENVRADKECVYKHGDGHHVPLIYSPFADHVRVALNDECFNKKIITFDHTKVKPVVVEKELVIREFSNFLKCLKKDTDKYLLGSRAF